MQQFIDIVVRSLRKDSVKTIFDVGSRDGAESVTLADYFKQSTVYAFECNPQTIPILETKIAHHPSIKFTPKAVSFYDGRTQFYPINPEKTVTSWNDGNPGASSLFVANGKYGAENYVQDTIMVDCIRLDTFCQQNNIDSIDILWMDLQGAELLALESLGKLLSKVKFINTEVTFKEMYTGQCLFEDVHEFLLRNNFRLVNEKETMKMMEDGHWQTDGIYINNVI